MQITERVSPAEWSRRDVDRDRFRATFPGGSRLRQLRVERSLSEEALAADAGSDRTKASRFERGLEDPTVGILEQLAGALGPMIVEFFVVPRPEEPPPKPLRGGRRPKR